MAAADTWPDLIEALLNTENICRDRLLPWSTPFEDPIVLPDGRQLLTLKDAADYITKLPKEESDLAQWQVAIETLMLCSRGGASMLARVAFMTAFNRNLVVPFNPSPSGGGRLVGLVQLVRNSPYGQP